MKLSRATANELTTNLIGEQSLPIYGAIVVTALSLLSIRAKREIALELLRCADDESRIYYDVTD